MLDICICTHNPRRGVLQTVVGAIAKQDLRGRPIRALIVDNASDPPLAPSILKPLDTAGLEARIVQEPVPGISRARLRAIHETEGDWVLFVDDDNEIAEDYVQQGFAFIADHPTVGCFGGKLLLAPDLAPPSWAEPFLPYLGIKDYGDDPIIECKDEWGPWEPPTAGAWVRRDVLEAYSQRARIDHRMFELGRTGGFDLASCEDSLMMRGAVDLGLSSAYNPELRLFHHLAPHRFEYGYLLPLIAAYGRSQVLLERLLGREYPLCSDYAQPDRFSAILDAIFDDKGKSARFRSAMMAWHITAKHQTLALASGESVAA